MSDSVTACLRAHRELCDIFSPQFIDALWNIAKQQEDNFIDLYFRYLSAKRDYPYAQHSPPPWPEVWKFHTHAVTIINAIEQEFRRSNP